MEDKIIYTRIDTARYQRLKKLLKEYNEKYPSLYKLKVSGLLRFLLEKFLSEVEYVEQLREFVEKNKV